MVQANCVEETTFDIRPTLERNGTFLDIWKNLSSSEKPLFTDFSPKNLQDKLWEHLFISEVCRAPFNIKFTFQGLFITEVLNRYFIGKTLNEAMFGEEFENVEGIFHKICQAGRPVLSTENIMTSMDKIISCEAIHVPFFNAHGEVSHIAGCLHKISSMPVPDSKANGKVWELVTSSVL